jgi:hypothetical protein
MKLYGYIREARARKKTGLICKVDSGEDICIKFTASRNKAVIIGASKKKDGETFDCDLRVFQSFPRVRVLWC